MKKVIVALSIIGLFAASYCSNTVAFAGGDNTANQADELRTKVIDLFKTTMSVCDKIESSNRLDFELATAMKQYQVPVDPVTLDVLIMKTREIDRSVDELRRIVQVYEINLAKGRMISIEELQDLGWRTISVLSLQGEVKKILDLVIPQTKTSSLGKRSFQSPHV